MKTIIRDMTKWMGKTVWLLTLLFIATSCHDEIPEPGGVDNIEITGDCIAFTVTLDKEMATRTGSSPYADQTYDASYDNYIDTQNKFRVFFFTEDGDYLFGAVDKVVGSSSTGSMTTDSWYVRVPMSLLIDRDNNEYDVEKIKTYLKNNPFKIAVLVNWPNAGEKISPGDYGDNTEEEIPSLYGEPLWGWKNSVLNAEAKKDDIKNINDLHHLYNDNAYNKSDAAKQSYRFIMDNGKLGEPVDWVKMRDIYKGWHYPEGKSPEGEFSNATTAETWIRNNWNPDLQLNENRKIYRHYQYLWYLWDFDAAYNSQDESEGPANYAKYNDQTRWGAGQTHFSNPWGKQWYKRNGKNIKAWLKKSYNNGSKKDLETRQETHEGASNNNNFLYYKHVAGSQMTEKKGVTGVSLKQATGTTTKNGAIYVSDKSSGFFKFTARTSGTLRIRYSSSSSNNDSWMNVQVGPKAPESFNSKTDQSQLAVIDVTVDDEPQDIYIFTRDKIIVIYSIEFIRSEYLYYTDREGKMPNEDFPIPMYGVQQFEPMADWVYGTTYNLTEKQDKRISLLRSVAKVLFNVPKSFGELSHVYMRSMNRTSRCEPMNVEMNTGELWKKNHPEYPTSNEEVEKGDWYNLMHYIKCYNSASQGSNQADYDDYAKWLNWLYGDWQNVNWKHELVLDQKDNIWKKQGEYKQGWDFRNSGFLKTTGYPQIFNAYINRTDFAAFTRIADYGDYYVYVIYMPEKYMEDPTSIGKRNSIPKVAHIEYRFTEKGETEDGYFHNSQFNLEDNECYRVYFTNYGDKSLINTTLYPVNTAIKSVNRTGYENYEKTDNVYKYHWPVLRNHIYEFYLGGSGPENPQINVKVKEWGHEKVVVEW